jgi:hypothetical protein
MQRHLIHGYYSLVISLRLCGFVFNHKGAVRTTEFYINSVKTRIFLLHFLCVFAVRKNKPPRRKKNFGEVQLYFKYSGYPLVARAA